MRLLTALRAGLDSLLHEILKFGAVGLLAFAVDVGLFNLLRYGPLSHKPLTAKLISVVLATGVAYLGNRHWTFRHRGSHGIGRETVLFLLVNALALSIALLCLGFSHYALGLTSGLADNISANVLGLGLGTVFRFWAYRRFVFPAAVEPAPESTSEPVPAAA